MEKEKYHIPSQEWIERLQYYVDELEDSFKPGRIMEHSKIKFASLKGYIESLKK